MILKSKRNSVLLKNGIVEKHFIDPVSFQKEKRIYEQCSNHSFLPKLLKTQDMTLFLEYKNIPTYLELLEQEFQPQPWKELIVYLTKCEQILHALPTDCNLRNFLWDGLQTIGIDFEEYESISFEECLSHLIAFIQLYEIKGKEDVLHYLQSQVKVDEKSIENHISYLIKRRTSKK